MSAQPYPSSTQDKFVLRLPDGMRDRIRKAAGANNRSMNAEIVATLEEKYPAPNRDAEARAAWKIYLKEARAAGALRSMVASDALIRAMDERDATGVFPFPPEEPEEEAEPTVTPDERLLDGRSLPLKPYLRQYGGKKPEIIREVEDANNMAWRVADHVNTLAANNPDEEQCYSFKQIAQDLGLTVSQVRAAIAEGNQEKIRVRLNKDARHSLEQFRRS